jgi:hypothetical protein
MDNVQKVNYCTNEPSSQTFRFYFNICIKTFFYIESSELLESLQKESSEKTQVEWDEIVLMLQSSKVSD